MWCKSWNQHLQNPDNFVDIVANFNILIEVEILHRSKKEKPTTESVQQDQVYALE